MKSSPKKSFRQKTFLPIENLSKEIFASQGAPPANLPPVSTTPAANFVVDTGGKQ